MWQKPILAGSVALAVCLLFTPILSAQAAPKQDDQIFVGDDVVLDEGERIDGDLVVAGGALSLLDGSRVTGNVVSFGGRVEIQGVIRGDLIVFGGDVILSESAIVKGELVVLGGELVRAPGAEVGKAVSGPTFVTVGEWRLQLVSPFASDQGESWLLTMFAMVSVAFCVGWLGLAISALWPTQTALVRETIVRAPGASLGVGCLLYPVVLGVCVLALITICLSPLVPVLMLLLTTAGLLGWVALASLLGRYLARVMGWRASLIAIDGGGAFLLTIIAWFFVFIPCLGVLLLACMAGLGLGAVALSRFGSRSYQRPSPPSDLVPRA